MAVGLHILYGVMGSGKTNYAVNELKESVKDSIIISAKPANPKPFKTFGSQLRSSSLSHFIELKKESPKKVANFLNKLINNCFMTTYHF